MYAIFHPLDPNERLPRELILEGRRQRWLRPRVLLWLGGVLYLPGIMLGIILLSYLNVGAVAAFALGGVLLVAVYIYAIRFDR